MQKFIIKPEDYSDIKVTTYADTIYTSVNETNYLLESNATNNENVAQIQDKTKTISFEPLVNYSFVEKTHIDQKGIKTQMLYFIQKIKGEKIINFQDLIHVENVYVGNSNVKVKRRGFYTTIEKTSYVPMYISYESVYDDTIKQFSMPTSSSDESTPFDLFKDLYNQKPFSSYSNYKLDNFLKESEGTTSNNIGLPNVTSDGFEHSTNILKCGLDYVLNYEVLTPFQIKITYELPYKVVAFEEDSNKSTYSTLTNDGYYNVVETTAVYDQIEICVSGSKITTTEDAFEYSKDINDNKQYSFARNSNELFVAQNHKFQDSTPFYEVQAKKIVERYSTNSTTLEVDIPTINIADYIIQIGDYIKVKKIDGSYYKNEWFMVAQIGYEYNGDWEYTLFLKEVKE